ncbi:hypothetical protein [Wolbachia endosymbiont of Wuchereria bancrofti]|uniref:hypothetical protein n=1 Tax=Wolbachia endosymbiont of Wuchereria bancrofti TaxID=96496 RepID=UPI00034DACB1|nr:hypothetical protein [Wolbachia endosymbiont of Wuchereria bancrofti]
MITHILKIFSLTTDLLSSQQERITAALTKEEEQNISDIAGNKTETNLADSDDSRDANLPCYTIR